MARFIYPAGGSGSSSADIADFIFTNEGEDDSTMTLPVNKEMTIETTRDDEGDADISIRAADDVFITALGDDVGINAFNEVYITANDDSHEWTFTNAGCIQLPDYGQICNPPNSSGDGYGLSTIQITPDINTEDDRYIIIDPTVPNHIHIRPGGEMDESSAELYLGGERTHIVQDDGAHEVRVSTGATINYNTYTNINGESNSNFIAESGPVIVDVGYKVNVDGTEYTVDAITPDTPAPGNVLISVPGATFQNGQMYTFIGDNGSNNYWMFGSDGILHGPEMGGGLIVNSLYGSDSSDLGAFSNIGYGIVLSGDTGEFLNDSSVPANQIATIGDVAAVATLYHGSFYSTQDQSASVNTATAMTYNEEDFADGITIENNSEITIANAGKYNIQFSAQLFHDGGGGMGETVNIWLAKNGNPVTNTNTKVVVQSNYRYVVAAWNFFVDAAANDYYEIMWATDNSSIDLVHENSGAYPAVPSVILTVNQIA